MLRTVLLGISSGIPLALTGATMQAWLSKAGIDTSTIGEFALVGLPYAMKFLWAPMMDAKALPFLGLRRGWMVICQLGLFAATVMLAFANPGANMPWFVFCAFLIAFFSASQDIVVDAYRIEIIDDPKELGAAAGTFITGYRVGMLISGGLGLIMAAHMSWQAVFVAMAVINLVGLVTVLFSPEPKVTRKLGRGNFRESVAQPFIEFFQRTGAMEIILFILVYKISTLMATALTTKYLISLGFETDIIGGVNKFQGLIATIAGTLVGGSLMLKFGIKRSLWIFGVIQAFVGIGFWGLSQLVTTMPDLKIVWLIGIVGIDNFMMGMGTAALTGFMMNFVSKQFTATQYALMTSVMAVSRVILIAHAGTLVEWLGWEWFFIATIPLAIPGLLMLSRYDHWQTMSTAPAHARIPLYDRCLIGLFIPSLIALSSDPVFKWMEMKDTGAMATKAGAIGVCVVVALGMIKPYLSFPRTPKMKTV
jgi:PAT family beta-lactamase induction signal transducer AmpG